MVIVRILVSLVNALLRIAAEALSHFVLLIAGALVVLAVAAAALSLSGFGAVDLLRWWRKRTKR